jgi:hypothetical protein
MKEALSSLKRPFHVFCLDNLKMKFLPLYLLFTPLHEHRTPHIPMLEHSILRGKTFHSEKPGRNSLLGK